MGPLDMQLAGEELYGAGAQPLLRKRVLLNGNTVVGSDWQQEPVGDGEWEIEVLRPSPQQAIHPLVMQRLDMLSRPAVSSAAAAVLRHANGRLSRVPADHRATFITDMQAHDRQRLCDAISPDSRQRTGSIARQLDLVSTRRNHQQRAGTLSELDAMVAEAVLHLSGSAALRKSMPWEAKVIDAYAELKREGLIRIQG